MEKIAAQETVVDRMAMVQVNTININFPGELGQHLAINKAQCLRAVEVHL